MISVFKMLRAAVSQVVPAAPLELTQGSATSKLVVAGAVKEPLVSKTEIAAQTTAAAPVFLEFVTATERYILNSRPGVTHLVNPFIFSGIASLMSPVCPSNRQPCALR